MLQAPVQDSELRNYAWPLSPSPVKVWRDRDLVLGMGRAKGKQAEERPKDDDDALLDAAIAENKATQKMKVQQPPEQKARGKGGKEVAAAAPGKALTKEQIMQKLNSVRRAPPAARLLAEDDAPQHHALRHIYMCV